MLSIQNCYVGAMPRKVAALNLNLLVVLDALLAERSVTRAGSRIGLSQPATSAALAQLRRYFDDDLLVRSGRGYELSPVALGLADPVREVITTVERAITGRDAFDPATADREFSIAVSDYVLMTLVPVLLPAVARVAPRVRLRIVPAELAVRGGPSGIADLFVAPPAFTFSESEEIFHDRWVFAVAANHPAVRTRLDLRTLRRLPQVRYSVGGIENSAQAHLDAIGLSRRAEVSVGSFVAALFLLRGTELITLTPYRLARRLQKAAGIRIVKPPFRIPDLVECTTWVPSFKRDPGHTWLRSIVREVARRL
jgi:DNA-binding transcriptional LysR family regulator